MLPLLRKWATVVIGNGLYVVKEFVGYPETDTFQKYLQLAEEEIADRTDYIAFEFKFPETAINTVKGFKNVINSLSLFPQIHELE